MSHRLIVQTRPRRLRRWMWATAAGIVLAGAGIGWAVDNFEQEAAPQPVDTGKVAELLLPTTAQSLPDCRSLPPIMRFLDAPCEQR